MSNSPGPIATNDIPRTRLGATPLEITRVGFGAWAIGGGNWQSGWGAQDDDHSVAAILHAVELGVTWIDTAPAYGLGHAEEVVGRALQALPDDDRSLVFTKCGLVWGDGDTHVTNVLAPASIRAECEASLRRLGVERIDLLQVHWPTQDGTPVEESWATMAALVDEGKVGGSASATSNRPPLVSWQTDGRSRPRSRRHHLVVLSRDDLPRALNDPRRRPRYGAALAAVPRHLVAGSFRRLALRDRPTWTTRPCRESSS